MKILLCNDDGIDAPGLWHAFHALEQWECEVVAPREDQSGVSHSTACFRTPLYVERRRINGVEAMVVAGTPADAVKFRLCESAADFDVMIAGINAGENCGIAQFYSGTVAAAREAALRGVPAIAISVFRDSAAHYRAAGEFLRTWIPRWFGPDTPERPPYPMVLNVNFPDRDPSKIRGVFVAQQSIAPYDDRFEQIRDGNGGLYAPIFGDRKRDRIEPGSDDWALREGYITVVPLRLDMTCDAGTSWLRSFDEGNPASPALRHGPAAPITREG